MSCKKSWKKELERLEEAMRLCDKRACRDDVRTRKSLPAGCISIQLFLHNWCSQLMITIWNLREKPRKVAQFGIDLALVWLLKSAWRIFSRAASVCVQRCNYAGRRRHHHHHHRHQQVDSIVSQSLQLHVSRWLVIVFIIMRFKG